MEMNMYILYVNTTQYIKCQYLLDNNDDDEEEDEDSVTAEIV